ncbi:hypothetical protein CDCA_CDCA04G1410 [Cyanidium caldarium]|uniref:RNA polymerase sigma-70 domain-containing protein n=1 Tax=Cyanidium caldarium TaxID=2771 RepID=A0AAV9ISW2_CYACA|nr:hypothetical protein CDCA_CDCA04G1410 [Cyanidium caldarium]
MQRLVGGGDGVAYVVVASTAMQRRRPLVAEMRGEAGAISWRLPAVGGVREGRPGVKTPPPAAADRRGRWCEHSLSKAHAWAFCGQPWASSRMASVGDAFQNGCERNNGCPDRVAGARGGGAVLGPARSAFWGGRRRQYGHTSITEAATSAVTRGGTNAEWSTRRLGVRMVATGPRRVGVHTENCNAADVAKLERMASGVTLGEASGATAAKTVAPPHRPSPSPSAFRRLRLLSTLDVRSLEAYADELLAAANIDLGVLARGAERGAAYALRDHRAFRIAFPGSLSSYVEGLERSYRDTEGDVATVEAPEGDDTVGDTPRASGRAMQILNMALVDAPPRGRRTEQAPRSLRTLSEAEIAASFGDESGANVTMPAGVATKRRRRWARRRRSKTKALDALDDIDLFDLPLADDEANTLRPLLDGTAAPDLDSDEETAMKAGEEPEEEEEVTAVVDEEEEQQEMLGLASSESGVRHLLERRARTNRDDSIVQFMREIGRVDLLTTEEEVALSRRVSKWLTIERTKKALTGGLGRAPTDAELADACGYQGDVVRMKRDMRAGRWAKERMVSTNMRLVVSIAKRFVRSGVAFQDLIQEGAVGLMRGVEKFNADRGFKFSTYATWWIRQAMTRFIADHSRSIRLPVHVNDSLAAIKRHARALLEELGRRPTEEELCARARIDLTKYRFLMRSARAVVSLETPVGQHDDDHRLGDMLPATSLSPDEALQKDSLRRDVARVLSTLTKRERDVIRLRYGFVDGRAWTLEEIGQLFSVTRERIRQIEFKAMRKLRHPSRGILLQGYAPDA